MNNPLAGTDPTGYVSKCDQNPTCQMQSFFSSVGSGGSSLIGNLMGRLKTTLSNGHDTKQTKQTKKVNAAAEVKSPAAVSFVFDRAVNKPSGGNGGDKGKRSDVDENKTTLSASKFDYISDEVETAFSYVAETEEGQRIISDIESNDSITSVFIRIGSTKGVGLTEVRISADKRGFGEKLWTALGFGEKYKLKYHLVITLDPTNVNNSFARVGGGSNFKASITRLLAHELGHAHHYSIMKTFRGGAKSTIGIENKISRELNPNAPIRHATDDHGTGSISDLF